MSIRLALLVLGVEGGFLTTWRPVAVRVQF